MITTGTYHRLIKRETTETELLTSLVPEHVSVQALFLLGSSKSYRKTGTIFSFDAPTASFTSHYYLLALIEKEEDHTLNAAQDKIENNLQHFIPTTAIVLSTTAFIAWLGKGHPFAVTVLTKAERLYQSENILLPIPSSINEEEQKEESELLFKQTKAKVEGFLASAELHKLRGEYKLSSFMLHQAAEQALRAMLICNTGLKVNTHSIDKLLRYCSMFCYQLPDLFAKNNEKEKKLYSLLNKAYIDTRYKDDYTITGEELTALTEKAKRIKELFEHYKPKTLWKQ
jgi:HEPN domain-containing protein